MTAPETIDRLCAAVESLAEVIRQQALFVEESKTIDEETKKRFAELRGTASTELEPFGISLLPSEACGKENNDG